MSRADVQLVRTLFDAAQKAGSDFHPQFGGLAAWRLGWLPKCGRDVFSIAQPLQLSVGSSPFAIPSQLLWWGKRRLVCRPKEQQPCEKKTRYWDISGHKVPAAVDHIPHNAWLYGQLFGYLQSNDLVGARNHQAITTRAGPIRPAPRGWRGAVRICRNAGTCGCAPSPSPCSCYRTSSPSANIDRCVK